MKFTIFVLKNSIFFLAFVFTLNNCAMQQTTIGRINAYRAQRDRILGELDIYAPGHATEEQKDALLHEYGIELLEKSKQLYADAESSWHITLLLSMLSGLTMGTPNWCECPEAQLIIATFGFLCHSCQKYNEAHEYKSAASTIESLIQKKISRSGHHHSD